MKLPLHFSKQIEPVEFSIERGHYATIHGQEVTIDIPGAVANFIEFAKEEAAIDHVIRISAIHKKPNDWLRPLFLFDDPAQFQLLVRQPQDPDSYAFQYPFVVKAQTKSGHVVYQKFSPIILVPKSEFDWAKEGSADR